jgi:D-sedoheptulose 7-phosphate isomerase
MKNMLKNRIDAIKLLEQKEDLLEKVDIFSKEIYSTLTTGKKVIFCGNGGSFSQAAHMSAELSGRFLKERKSQNSIVLGSNLSSLTSIGNDYSFEQIFSRELEGIGESGDILIAYSTSGNSSNITNVLNKARNMNIKSILFSGNDGGEGKQYCDYDFIIPDNATPIIQELHLIVGHIILEAVDFKL